MIIIHGDKNKGKTTKVKALIEELISQNKSISGFYSEKVISNNQIAGYDLVTVADDKTYPFLTVKPIKNAIKIGRFYIDKKAIQTANQIIQKAIKDKVDYIIIDEVGQLELDEQGWFNIINILNTSYYGTLIFCIRTEFVKQVIQKWSFDNITFISI